MRWLGIMVAVVVALGVVAFAVYHEMGKPVVTWGKNAFKNATPDFAVGDLPRPMADDAAAGATFSLLTGRRDQLVADPDVLHDGTVPPRHDQLNHFFSFDHHTDGGRLLIDLGRVVRVARVNTYSLHDGGRSCQIYKLYASDGSAKGFDPKSSGVAGDPAASGWSLVASVDTRVPGENPHGQYAVSVATRGGGALGRYRYLLFDMEKPEPSDPYSQTQYCEIDVIDADAPPAKRAAVDPPAAAPLGR
jgi:hypothetical protein